MTLLDGRLTPSDEIDEISSLAHPLSDPADLDRLLVAVEGDWPACFAVNRCEDEVVVSPPAAAGRGRRSRGRARRPAERPGPCRGRALLPHHGSDRVEPATGGERETYPWST